MGLEINFRGKGSKKRKPQAILTVSEGEKEFCRLLWDQEYQERLRQKGFFRCSRKRGGLQLGVFK